MADANVNADPSSSSNNSNQSNQVQNCGKKVPGSAPILLAVPTPGVPRRRHSWICGWV